tara:strand:+ start:1373 stop:1795 length:423 start_codon:yes stop_codon:yes gene_type:complete
MRAVKRDEKTGLPEKYLSGSKNREARAKSIKEGQKAYKEGRRLPDSYFKERQEFKKGGKVKTGKGAKEGRKPLSASTIASLKKKAKSSGKSLSTLKKVYRRGQGAYLSSGSRPKTSMAAWAMGRVNSFIRGSKKHDTDLR